MSPAMPPGAALPLDPSPPQGPPTPGDGQIVSLLETLRREYAGNITGQLTLPAEPGRYVDFPAGLAPRLAGALRARAIERLYCHQADAWHAIRAGRHSVIVTPTASGKSLAYNLPVLQAAIEARHKALYLFPTKALSQDQVAELLGLNRAGGLGIKVHTFDGDTPGDARKAVRTRGDIVVTNPDMLHQGILPHHTKWAQLFENLAYVVIDELHVYRGVFGSHVANVVRRLKRICEFYGRRPVFILCSATIANPADLASRLIGEPVHAITGNGAPRGEKHLLLWNPPVVNRDLGIRASARSQSARLARLAIRRGLKTIVFARTRLMVEVLTKYLKDKFDADPRRPSRVAAYRGGYLPTERRKTENDLRAGRVDCVVATSALELGVDIGSLDVCILNGYPGTVAGTWQRLGRAGRRNRPSLGVLVASSAPLDQYIVRNPDFFLGASPEHARIDPEQLLILLDHVRCAAFELPFRDGEGFGAAQIDDLLDYLEREQVLHHEGTTWHWMAEGYPANSVSLRSVANGNFVVIDRTGGGKKVIAEVDYGSAAMTLYEGAIYMVQARPWQVEALDWEGRKAFVTETTADYYTDAIDYTRLRVLEEFERDAGSAGLAAHGETHLLRRVAGYKKIRYYTHENVGYGKVDLPDQEMHTTAVWWQLDAKTLEDSFPSRTEALDGFLGAAYALHLVAALLTLSETRDLGRAVGNSDAAWFSTVDARHRGVMRSGEATPPDISDPASSFCPTVFIYDNYPGGIGLSQALFDLREQVVDQGFSLIAGCECRNGCPACVGPVLSHGDHREHSPRSAALQVLDLFRRG